MRRLFLFFCLNNRGWPIRVAGVVVVDVAAGVHIPGVVRVVAIRRTQTDVLRYSLIPNFLFTVTVSFHVFHMPVFEQCLCFK